MPTSMSRRASVVLAGLACAGSMTLAQAAPMSFSVPLAGSQEVPPVQTQGTGTADLTYDPDTRVVKWTVTFSGLSSAAIMAHFHGPAPVGKNASPLGWLSQKGAMCRPRVRSPARRRCRRPTRRRSWPATCTSTCIPRITRPVKSAVRWCRRSEADRQLTAAATRDSSARAGRGAGIAHSTRAAHLRVAAGPPPIDSSNGRSASSSAPKPAQSPAFSRSSARA